MSINKGGRGKKAPYTSSIVRVPDPLLIEVSNLIEKFRDEDYIPNDSAITVDEAIETARKLLSQKKSARETVKKLLQVLYKKEDINL